MPEYSDFTPAPWAPAVDSFKDAKSVYDVHVGRSYNDAIKKGVTVSDLVPDKMVTETAAPIIILCDQTGSMGKWPATIFSKLPYLDHEAKFYFGDDYRIAFGAFGDANCGERYPVQIRPFAEGKELEERLKELVIEGGGGGQVSESAELPCAYVDANVEAPNAVRPILIIITDEKCYETVNKDQAEQYAKVAPGEKTDMTADLFDRLKKKWAVYLVRKPYELGSDDESGNNRQIREFWEKLVGEDHMALLPDASRVVDVIFGIFAKETGKIEDFKKELVDRQMKDLDGDKKVEVTMKALMTIHKSHVDEMRDHAKLPHKHSMKLLPGAVKGASVTRRKSTGKTKRSAGLLDD